ncbi:hypothetical protein ASZ90_015049 [hydrocarbon metagenome]|uniref:Uncharacterized protein n=1 Tax=hydrocarbon metagenome TaxID=938273 RepID=A0A0W8F339_9ZZZZ
MKGDQVLSKAGSFEKTTAGTAGVLLPMMGLANPAILSTPAFPVSWVPVRRDHDRAPEFMYRGDPLEPVT